MIKLEFCPYENLPSAQKIKAYTTFTNFSMKYLVMYNVYTDTPLLKWNVQVNVSLNNCKQNMMSLSLLAGRTVKHVNIIVNERTIKQAEGETAI